MDMQSQCDELYIVCFMWCKMDSKTDDKNLHSLIGGHISIEQLFDAETVTQIYNNPVVHDKQIFNILSDLTEIKHTFLKYCNLNCNGYLG